MVRFYLGYPETEAFLRYDFDKLVDISYKEMVQGIKNGNLRYIVHMIISKACAWAVYNHGVSDEERIEHVGQQD